MQLFKEFKEFAVKGNILELAIGVIIGTAFGKITASFVSDIIMPPLGLLIANIDFKRFRWVIGMGPEGEIGINYGNFIQTIIDFLIIAFSIFIVLKFLSKLHKKEKETENPVLTKQEELLTEIRDLLKKDTSTTP